MGERRQDVPLGRWFGIPVRAHWSVLVALGLFVVLVAVQDLPAERPGSSPMAYWTAGVAVAVVFFVTLLVHELAHAAVARHFGIGVRGITLWMLGGVSELTGPAPSARAEAWVALSGPLASLMCGVAFAGAASGVGTGSVAGAALVWLATINVLLAGFNLLPGSPLDGGRLLRAALWARGNDRVAAAVAAARAGRILGLALVGLGLLELALGALGGAWLGLLGWFIATSADAERSAAWAERLEGHRASEAMTPTPTLAPEWWTVERLISSLTPASAHQPVLPVVSVDGGFRGVVTLADLERVPPVRRPGLLVREVVSAREGVLQVAPTDDLADVVLRMRSGRTVAVVVDAEHPVGAIAPADIDQAVRLAGIGQSHQTC